MGKSLNFVHGNSQFSKRKVIGMKPLGIYSFTRYYYEALNCNAFYKLISNEFLMRKNRQQVDDCTTVEYRKAAHIRSKVSLSKV